MVLIFIFVELFVTLIVRRWKVLFPHEVPQLQAARKIQKVALISNFVDRESERPALGPNDFAPLPNCITESNKVDPSSRKRRRSRYVVSLIRLSIGCIFFVFFGLIDSLTVCRRGKNCTGKNAPPG